MRRNPGRMKPAKAAKAPGMPRSERPTNPHSWAGVPPGRQSRNARPWSSWPGAAQPRLSENRRRMWCKAAAWPKEIAPIRSDSKNMAAREGGVVMGVSVEEHGGHGRGQHDPENGEFLCQRGQGRHQNNRRRPAQGHGLAQGPAHGNDHPAKSGQHP